MLSHLGACPPPVLVTTGMKWLCLQDICQTGLGENWHTDGGSSARFSYSAVDSHSRIAAVFDWGLVAYSEYPFCHRNKTAWYANISVGRDGAKDLVGDHLLCLSTCERVYAYTPRRQSRYVVVPSC